MVQHANIPDANLHEPKGAATALQGTVYVANGAGSGSWVALPNAYAQVGIIGNTSPFTVAAASDAALNTNSEYAPFTGPSAGLAGGINSNISFASDRLTITIAGVYKLSLVATISGFPSTTAKVAFKVRVSDSNYVARKAIAQAVVSSSTVQAVSEEIVSLAAGATLQLYIASTNAGSVVVSDLSFVATLVKAS